MDEDVIKIVNKGKPYFINKYSERGDPTLEALKLIANARELFFGIAEDDIDVPSHLRDKVTGKLISNKREIAETAIRSREALCEKTNDKFAYAKLAGAYVAMIEVLADETLESHYAGRTQEANASRHKIGEYYKKVQKLIPNINLKGRKADIDHVLLSILGELPKAAILENEIVHDYEYINKAAAMYQVDVLTDWMKDRIARAPAFAGCRDTIIQLGEEAKKRINLHREELAACDEGEVKIRILSRSLREKIITAVNHNNKLHPLANDLLQSSDIIGDMLRQSEKRVSVSLMIGIGQIDDMSVMLEKMLSTLPLRATQAPRKALDSLHTSAMAHMQNMLRHGIPREYFATDFSRSALNAANAQFDVPPHLTRDAQPVIEAFRKGVDIMKRLPPDITKTPDHIIPARDAVTAEIADFAARYGQLTQQRRK